MIALYTSNQLVSFISARNLSFLLPSRRVQERHLRKQPQALRGLGHGRAVPLQPELHAGLVPQVLQAVLILPVPCETLGVLWRHLIPFIAFFIFPVCHPLAPLLTVTCQGPPFSVLDPSLTIWTVWPLKMFVFLPDIVVI